MSKRIYRIILALLTVALISALFLLNPQTAEVHLGRGHSYMLPMALILILTFVAGSLFAFALAFVSQFQLSWEAWRERRLRTSERAHLKDLVGIRELVALENYQEASVKLSQILKEDADNAVARSLLATCQDELGNPLLALRTLEEGRGRAINSSELYLKAATIYEKQGNLTAALDNISLLLKSHPNSKKVLREGVRIAERLDDLDRAVQFQERLLKVTNNMEYQDEQARLAKLELSNIKKKPQTIQPEELSRLLKKHRTFAPAYEFQAELDQLRGESELATRSYLRGFELSGDTDILAKVAMLWLKKDDPDKAVRNIKTALRDKDSLFGRAYLVCLTAALGMSDEASKELVRLEANGNPLIQLATIMVAQCSDNKHDPVTIAVQETILLGLSSPIRESLKFLGAKRSNSKGFNAPKEQPSLQISVP
jgi:tetratricopeptide (TPR) repeat protein